jgi:acetylornithine deacetylase
MRRLALPYPVSVGTVNAGEWASTVPDRLTFEGRLGVRVGESEEAARAGLAAALDGRVELAWPGGRYASAETPVDHPFVVATARAVAAELGRPAALAGVPYGADLRLFVARGIPCVMCGPRGQHLAHAVDERVAVADLVAVARIVARLGAAGF